MRSRCAYVLLSVALTTFNGSIVVGEQHTLLPRQDISPKASSTTISSAGARVTESPLGSPNAKVASSADADGSSENAHRAKTDSSLGVVVKATSSVRTASSETATVPTASTTGSVLSSNASNGT